MYKKDSYVKSCKFELIGMLGIEEFDLTKAQWDTGDFYDTELGTMYKVSCISKCGSKPGILQDRIDKYDIEFKVKPSIDRALNAISVIKDKCKGSKISSIDDYLKLFIGGSNKKWDSIPVYGQNRWYSVLDVFEVSDCNIEFKTSDYKMNYLNKKIRDKATLDLNYIIWDSIDFVDKDRNSTFNPGFDTYAKFNCTDYCYFEGTDKYKKLHILIGYQDIYAVIEKIKNTCPGSKSFF